MAPNGGNDGLENQSRLAFIREGGRMRNCVFFFLLVICFANDREKAKTQKG